MIPCLIPDMPSVDELAPHLRRIDENKWYSNGGPLVRELESQLSTRFCDGAHVVTTSSGTSALEIALRDCGMTFGSKVLCPSLSFPATACAIINAGYQPVFCDVDELTWSLTPEIVRDIYDVDFDAIMPVAAFGAPVNADGWDVLSLALDVHVVIDAAAALGAQKIGKYTTTCFSMHATKPFGVGEGGLIVTRDEAEADGMRMATNFGLSNRGSMFAGTNAKLSEYHAAVGLAQLERWERSSRARNNLRDEYMLKLHSDVYLQGCGWDPPIPAVLPARVPDAKKMQKKLASAGIETRRWYCPPLHEHPAFRDYAHTSMPNTNALSRELLCLPFHLGLSEAQVHLICETLGDILCKR